jgi:hypothetical protein
MKKRSPLAVFLWAFPTIGIYSWYWAVKTKGELNRRGGSVPTAWIWLIPVIGGIYWYWKYSEAVQTATQGKTTAVVSFLLLFFLGMIGQAVLQNAFNKVDLPEGTGALQGPGGWGVPAS